MFSSRLLLTCLFFAVGIQPAMAEEKERRIDPANKAFQKLAETLDQAEKQHLANIFGGHNAIHVVKSVEKTLGIGSESCGEKHEDLKENIDTRYGEWKTAVNEIIDAAQANIDNMIAVQDYAKTSDIKAVLKLLDESRANYEASVNKVPVTSKEGCEFMLENMDESQEQLIKYLQATLISLPLQMQEDLTEAQEAEDSAASENDSSE